MRTREGRGAKDIGREIWTFPEFFIFIPLVFFLLPSRLRMDLGGFPDGVELGVLSYFIPLLLLARMAAYTSPASKMKEMEQKKKALLGCDSEIGVLTYGV
ncbi:hypothetical protein QBC33DRAFT_541448 [Phialemonium atrogriseum]|uniref:Uncharacterized protein n=1 Tax=Phialemonium atrogriseum TaxID=1093897 RepID=A0AAJ0FMW5_9PEZI|nr:uncharacterized protein QBC33DRAFT_541448 [Phialemonium atrogriseum]KAK1766560.1 hypothetical protein QBC33DRAFT_541448 [Phialemonium atrogriseum]